MQNDGPDKLFTVLSSYISKGVVSNKNRAKTWLYGYNEKYDVVIISKTGQIGDIIDINGLRIALPTHQTHPTPVSYTHLTLPTTPYV